MPQLYELLYVSELAPETPVTAVGNIINVARKRNARDEITGALVFDGMNFCQHLEGPFDQVVDCMRRIQQDPRHASVQILSQGALHTRRFREFSLGYAESDSVGSAIDALRMLSGPAAIQRFFDLVPQLDMRS